MPIRPVGSAIFEKIGRVGMDAATPFRSLRLCASLACLLPIASGCMSTPGEPARAARPQMPNDPPGPLAPLAPSGGPAESKPIVGLPVSPVAPSEPAPAVQTGFTVAREAKPAAKTLLPAGDPRT